MMILLEVLGMAGAVFVGFLMIYETIERVSKWFFK